MGGGKSGGSSQSSGPSYEQQKEDQQTALDKQTSDYAVLLQKQQEEYKTATETQSKNYAAEMVKQQQAAEVKDAQTKISDLFTVKYDAASASTDAVNSQIADELAHAKLVGLDYAVDPTVKQNRINDLFASKWSDVNDASLSGLMDKYGDQGYKWDLPVARGNPDNADLGLYTPGDTAGKAVEKGKKRAAPKVTTDENPLGGATILG